MAVWQYTQDGYRPQPEDVEHDPVNCTDPEIWEESPFPAKRTLTPMTIRDILDSLELQMHPAIVSVYLTWCIMITMVLIWRVVSRILDAWVGRGPTRDTILYGSFGLVLAPIVYWICVNVGWGGGFW